MAGAEAGEVDTVQEGGPQSGPDRGCWSAVRREEYGLALHFVEDHLLSSLEGRGVGRGHRGPETSVFRSRRHHGRDGGLREEAGTAVTSR